MRQKIFMSRYKILILIIFNKTKKIVSKNNKFQYKYYFKIYKLKKLNFINHLTLNFNNLYGLK